MEERRKIIKKKRMNENNEERSKGIKDGREKNRITEEGDKKGGNEDE